VQGEKVVCSICDYSSNLGYGITFGPTVYEGNYVAIQNDEQAVFTIDYSGDEVLLTYQP
jgi:hypothetical protein